MSCISLNTVAIIDITSDSQVANDNYLAGLALVLMASS